MCGGEEGELEIVHRGWLMAHSWEAVKRTPLTTASL